MRTAYSSPGPEPSSTGAEVVPVIRVTPSYKVGASRWLSRTSSSQKMAARFQAAVVDKGSRIGFFNL